MEDNKKNYHVLTKLFSSKRSQLGDAGFIRPSSSEGTLDVGSRKFFAGFLSILAIILWVVDISTSFFGLFPLGPVYSGFNFNPQDFWNNWFSSFTFGNVFFDAVLALTILFMVVKYTREKTPPNPVDIVSIFFGLLAVIFLLTNTAWMAFPKAVFHFLVIITFGIYVWRTSSMSAGFLVVFGLIFFDFFLFSTLLKFIPFLQYISLLGAIIIAITFGQSPTGVTGTSFFLLLLFIVVMTVANGTPAQGVLFTESEFQKASLNEVLDKLTRGISNYQRQVSLGVQKKIQYAITGKVEENQYEPLGVYLEGVKSVSSKYYEGEDVTVWGTVKAKTLDDPINIKIGCYVKDGTKKIGTKNVDPKNKFSVFTLEEQDFACTFDKNNDPDKFKSGSKTITTFADFNFETLAFLKVYFMDRERLRAMTRENLDPFQEFDIKDKKPTAVYTNGPLEIGMETTTPLVGVSSSYLVYPRLSLSFQNRVGWEGKIIGLNELILLFPKGVKLTSPSTDCNMKFEEYDPSKCSAACDKFVKKECYDVCEKHTGDDEGEVQRVIKNCKDLCDDEFSDCQTECGFLFQDEGEKYTGYALKQESIDEINKKLSADDDYERFKFFSCKIHPKPKEVLGNTPVTTKSFRVKTRYNYSVEKPITVSIVKDPSKDGTGKLGDFAVKGKNEIQQTIIDIARKKDVDPAIALAVVEVESNFRHCCQDEDKRKSKLCTPTIETDCPKNRLLLSADEKSVGIMQITPSSDWQKYIDTCERKDLADLNCGITVGISILKEKYDKYKSGLSETYFRTTSDQVCEDEKYIPKYASYKDWLAAARGYNGWGCGSELEANYVDRVQEAYNRIKSGQLPQKGFSTIEPPTNFKVVDISAGSIPKISISWDKSKSDNVDGYAITKYTAKLLADEIITINVGNVNIYSDEKVKYGESYKYQVSAKSGNYQSIQTNSEQITLIQQ
tara:strand:+ start:1415 stop:4273 length:2859 start_codon:yes stop_codon:yes gene_type:complete